MLAATLVYDGRFICFCAFCVLSRCACRIMSASCLLLGVVGPISDGSPVSSWSQHRHHPLAFIVGTAQCIFRFGKRVFWKAMCCMCRACMLLLQFNYHVVVHVVWCSAWLPVPVFCPGSHIPAYPRPGSICLVSRARAGKWVLNNCAFVSLIVFRQPVLFMVFPAFGN